MKLLLKVIPLEILLFLILCEIRFSTDGANVCGNSPGFECHDASKCIPLNNYCNGSNQCSDGSDEMLYNKTIHSTTGISCGHRINRTSTYCYLPNQYVCDHEINCFWGEDEKNCSHTFECGYVAFANKTQYKIKIVFCDNVVNCMNGADEIKYSPGAPGYQCSVTKTHLTNYCMLPNQYVCDGTNDCDYGTDECFCSEGDSSNIYTGDNCFRCLNRELVVPNKQRCDGAFHCNDLSDECLCTKRPPICEQICKVGENCGSCKVGEIKCKTSSDGFEKCINRTNVCDRIVDCAMGEDEKNCSVHESQLFQCNDKKQFVQNYQRCDNSSDCSDGSDELGCQSLYKCLEPRYENGVAKFDRAAYTESCDKIALCEDLDDECNSTICGPDLPAYCDHVNGALGFICPNSKSAIIGTEVCDGYPTCNESARTTSADELNCPNRFYCADHGATRLPIHIAPEARCNAITDCFDGSDEVNCSTATHFYCVPGTADYIPRSKVCNGVLDCKHGQNDECQNCAISPFSTDAFLISNYFLQAFIWIVGFLAIFGNIAVLVHNGLQMYENKNTSAIAYCNRILVLNLAMSDFLLGVYLLSIGIVNSVYANTYCVTDIEWRTSVSCAGLGSIALISVQTSVFILTIMTTFRLILVTQPFNSTVRVEVIGGVLALAWAFSFVIALVPHSWGLLDYFSSKAWLTDNPYLFVTNRTDVEQFVQRLWSLQDQNTMYFSNGST
ncbi:glycoprotein 330-like [Ciona intestinalis]